MRPGAPLNPFSARFHEPGAVPYRFREGESAEALWRCFVVRGRRGEIFGPHGTGKTTLLRALETAARSAGEETRTVTLHDGERWPLRLLTPHRMRARCATLIVDGAEQLAPALWAVLRTSTRLARWGLLVTTHRPLGLPLLRKTVVDRGTASWVVEKVLARNPKLPKLVTPSVAGEALAACNGDLREALFRLYDWYEERWAASPANGVKWHNPPDCVRASWKHAPLTNASFETELRTRAPCP